MMKRLKFIALFLAVIMLAALCWALVSRPLHVEAEPEAAPLDQAASRTIWYDQTITTAGKESTVVVGSMEYVSFFLYVDTPPAAETITITWKQGATVGGHGYVNDGTEEVVSHFVAAQEYMTYTAYTDGRLYPYHYFSVTPHTNTITASLFMMRR